MSTAQHTPALGPVYDSTGRLMAAVGPLTPAAAQRQAAEARAAAELDVARSYVRGVLDAKVTGSAA